jgi:hypothetical protein
MSAHVHRHPNQPALNPAHAQVTKSSTASTFDLESSRVKSIGTYQRAAATSLARTYMPSRVAMQRIPTERPAHVGREAERECAVGRRSWDSSISERRRAPRGPAPMPAPAPPLPWAQPPGHGRLATNSDRERGRRKRQGQKKDISLLFSLIETQK